MEFLFFLFFQQISCHICKTASIQSKINVIGTPETKKKQLFSTKIQRNPIRITSDYQYLRDTPDPLRCITSGQIIKWGDTDENFTCDAEDLLTPNKIQVLTGIIDNAKTYLTNFLQVTRYSDTITLQNNVLNYADIQQTVVTDCDLHITVISRPFGPVVETLALSFYNQYYIDSKRPCQGFIVVNPKAIPERIQDEFSEDNSFFFVILHEMMHTLGFIIDAFPFYHPPDSNTPYDQILCSITDQYDKNHTFLVTPNSHKYAQIHYGVDTFKGVSNSCPSGIELEDGGYVGHYGSHLEGRLFYTEFMVASLVLLTPFMRITDATAAVLLDTGNYDLNFSMIRPIVWGNGDSITGHPISNFALGPPSTTYPSLYLYSSDTDTNDCSFDYQFIGMRSQILTPECPNSTTEELEAFCKSPSFYNALNLEFIGSNWLYDFAPLKYPKTICPPRHVALAGNGFCIPYYLGDEQIIFTALGGLNRNQNFSCTPSNEGAEFIYNYASGSEILIHRYQCPTFERFIRTLELEASYFADDPFSSTSSNKYYIPPGSISYLTNEHISSSYTPVIPSSNHRPSVSLENPSPQLPPTSDSTPNLNNQEEDKKDQFLNTNLSNSAFYGIISAICVLIAIIIIVIFLVVRYKKSSKIAALSEEEVSDESSSYV